MRNLFRGSLLVAITLFLGTLNVNAQTGAPRFSDYPVNERYNGRTAPLVLSRAAREFRTRLREAAREKPNFAGHFIVTTWGCGTECVEGAIIDARTGRVFMLPFTLCCWGPVVGVDDGFKPVEFRVNSSLHSPFGSEKREGRGLCHPLLWISKQPARAPQISPALAPYFLARAPALFYNAHISRNQSVSCSVSPQRSFFRK